MIPGLGALEALERLREGNRRFAANVRAAAGQVRRGSELLEELTRAGGLLVVGAEYSLETGVVDLFDGVPEAG